MVRGTGGDNDDERGPDVPSSTVSVSPSAEERLRRIRSLTDSALAHLDAESLLVELLDRVCETLGVDTAAILRLSEPAGELIATAARGLEDEVRQDARIPLGKGFAGRIAAERRPIVIDDVDHSAVLNPVLREKGVRSLLGVPLMADGDVLGVLHVGTLTPRAFTVEDVDLLQLVGDRVALALRARDTVNDRLAGRALQRSLVPERLPQLPGLELASRYVPAEEHGVGGDWYDLFAVPSGHVCIVVGDVVGRGLKAAVVMGRLRSTSRAYALEVVDPALLLDRVDRKLQHFEPAQMATALVAVLDPSLDRMRISVAGHPAPVLARPGEPSVFLDLPVDPPLGAGPRRERRTTTVDLPAGALLCFFTDGLVERRDAPLDERLEMLRAAVAAESPDRVCWQVMGRLVGPDRISDDIAVLALRRETSAEQAVLDLTVPAVAASLRSVRVAVRRWLASAGAGPGDVADLLTAIGEACSNAVEHAYGPRQGTIGVRLELDGAGIVVATVRDTGHWREPRGVNRGRGIRLMEQTSDQVGINPGPAGTEVVIRRRLGSLSRDDAGPSRDDL
jgi:serine phosphatase RsbU (regulator of sigma subunit)/anti-sigma regulatory factor (Ser/Thr protein kinase)